MSVEDIAQKIEDYHQANYWNLFPAGTIPKWVYDAVLENIVKPLLKEKEA